MNTLISYNGVCFVAFNKKKPITNIFNPIPHPYSSFVKINNIKFDKTSKYLDIGNKKSVLFFMFFIMLEKSINKYKTINIYQNTIL